MFHVKFEPLRGEEVAIVLHLGEGYHFIIKEQCGTKKNSAACSCVHKKTCKRLRSLSFSKSNVRRKTTVLHVHMSKKKLQTNLL